MPAWVLLLTTVVFVVYEGFEPENPINTVGDVVEFLTGAVGGLGVRVSILEVVMVDYNLIAQIMVLVLAILSTYLGKRYKKARRVLDDLAKALDDTDKALDDNKLTPQEVQQLIKDWKRLIEDV